MIRVKNTIGFRDRSADEEIEAVSPAPAPVQEREPVACVAKIRFKDANRALDYYNDEFYLEPGDKVFVSGKFYGKLGLVESVTTHFRIDKAKYKKVIGKPDLRITGNFTRVNDKMVSFDTNFDTEKFAAVVIPPRDPESEEEEEIICGEGWSIDLMDFEESECVNGEKIMPALEYCTGGKVLYFSMKGGKCSAFIRGSRVYRADFSFDGETVSDFYCSCPFNDNCLCKHEIAVLITLRMLLGCPELEGKDDFVAFDAVFFRDFVAGEVKEIELK